jgi:hypothetical protein
MMFRRTCFSLGPKSRLTFALAIGTIVILASRLNSGEPPRNRASAKVNLILVEPNLLVSRDGNVPHTETVVAANPIDANNFVGAGIVFARDNGGMTCKTYASKDGGVTWLDTAFPERMDFSSADPQIGFGPTGTAYFLMLSTGRGAASHYYRSKDGGFTWRREADLPVQDHPMMVVDHSAGRFRGRVYLSTMRGLGELIVLHSKDDGVTFGDPVPVAFKDSKGLHLNEKALVLNDGSLFVPYEAWDDPPKKESPNKTVYCVRSSDGGHTFSGPESIVSYPFANKEVRDRVYPLIGTGLHPTFATDPRPKVNRVYAAWIEPLPQGHRLFIKTSTNSGASWSDPQAVDPGAKKGEQFQPMLAVNGEGIVGVAWFDSRNFDKPEGYDVYFSASLDGGKSFLTPKRVSSTFSHARGPGNSTPYPNFVRRLDDGLEVHCVSAYRRWGAGGDYSGITVDAAGGFRPFWPDSRTGTFQIWTSRIRVAPSDKVLQEWLGEPEGLTFRSAHKNVSLVFDPPTYDEKERSGDLSLRLKNQGAERIYAPLKMEIKKAEHWQVRGRDKDEENNLEIDMTPALRDLPYLAPGGLTESVRLRFKETDNSGLFILKLEIKGRVVQK